MPDIILASSVLNDYCSEKISKAQAILLLVAMGYSREEVKKLLNDVDSQKEKPNDKR